MCFENVFPTGFMLDWMFSYSRGNINRLFSKPHMLWIELEITNFFILVGYDAVGNICREYYLVTVVG